MEILEEVKNVILNMANLNGYKVSKNLDSIAKAKLRFFGESGYMSCPCVRDDEHYCISTKCKEAIEKDGKCHCNLYMKGED